MKKTISVVALASIFAASSAMASGWRIPEQSVDSTAKAGANIASSTRADTAYFNPANMTWMEDTWQLEADLTYIYLSPIDYDDARTPLFDGSSESENFLIPTVFVVSPSYGGARFGMAITAPGGLAKRWKDRYPRATAEKFSLEVIEANPTVSYGLGDKFSAAVGARMIYAYAKVRSNASGLGTPVAWELDGNTIEWGWNAAIALQATDKLNISTTYRSKVDLELDTAAKLALMGNFGRLGVEASVPLPAVYAISVAYDVMDNFNVELTWDRTFWSKYDTLDFDFTPMIPGNPFEPPRPKDWDDTNAFRIGLTYGLNDTITLMGGFAYDENPAPTRNISFELPDSDAWIYSVGMQYKVNEKMDLGLAALYDYKESRTVKVNPDPNSLDPYGEFKNASAFLLTVGLNYKF